LEARPRRLRGLAWWLGKTRTQKTRRENDDSFLPREAGKGDRPERAWRAEDGGRGVNDEAGLYLDAPSTTLRVVPLPRSAGADEESLAARINEENNQCDGR
jgi:hypothetical protein